MRGIFAPSDSPPCGARSERAGSRGARSLFGPGRRRARGCRRARAREPPPACRREGGGRRRAPPSPYRCGTRPAPWPRCRRRGEGWAGLGWGASLSLCYPARLTAAERARAALAAERALGARVLAARSGSRRGRAGRCGWLLQHPAGASSSRFVRPLLEQVRLQRSLLKLGFYSNPRESFPIGDCCSQISSDLHQKMQRSGFPTPPDHNLCTPTCASCAQ